MTVTFNSIGKPIWLLLAVIGFIWFWPIGVAIVAYLIWSDDWTSSLRWKARGFLGSGNSAFDEHRTETLKKLEQEQQDFRDFVNKLRTAKDKAEFDQFMQERKD